MLIEELPHQQPVRRFGPFLLLWIFLIVVAVLAVRAVRAPEARPATSAENEFSAERAMAHVHEIARVPHPVGSEADNSVRQYLIGQLTQLGLQPRVFSSIGISSNGQNTVAGRVNDIVGRLAGRSGGPTIMLMAHYDSVYRAPGAADDAAGVAAILETLRALRHGPALQRDLVVLFTDGEEAGLLGARAFAHSDPLIKDVGVILNFEARGNSGPSLLFETSTNNQALIDAVGHAAPYPIGSSLFYELYKMLPNDTDVTVFRPLHIPALNFAFGEHLVAYHSSLDTADNLSTASLQHHGSYCLSLAKYFGQSDLGELNSAHSDDIFFNWYGHKLITYNQRWVLPMELITTLLLAVALTVAVRRPALRVSRFLLGVLVCLFFLITVTAVSTAGWWVISMVLQGKRVSGDAPTNLFLLCGLLLLGAWVGCILLTLLLRRFTSRELTFAGLLLWCLLSWALTLRLSSGSYLLIWPLLLAVLGALMAELRSKDDRKTQWIPALPGVAATVLLFAPVVYLVYVFLTLQLISVAATGLLLGLVLLISLPPIGVTLAGQRWRTSVPLGVLAIICLTVGIALSHPTPDHPRTDTINYSLNADDGTAIWFTYGQQADEYTLQFLTDKAQSHPIPDYTGGLAQPLLSINAPVAQMPAPVAENIDHKKDGNKHALKMTLRSARNADLVYLRFANDVEPVSVKLDGRDVPLSKGGRFGFNLFGMGAQGVELEITAMAPSSLSFWVADRSLGLPGNVPPRPSSIIAGDGSDGTLVCRKYSL
jgi:Peptidase family M28